MPRRRLRARDFTSVNLLRGYIPRSRVCGGNGEKGEKKVLADWRILARRRAGPTPAAGRVVPLPLPPVPIPGAASAAATGKGEKEIDRRLADPGATSLSLVRYRTNDYSVPVAYGYRDVLVRGYVDEVVFSCGSEVIARHHRSYERDDFVYDPIHYLPFLERKTGALDQAAPLHGWELPKEFGTLRRLLESGMGHRGKREYVQVLRLLETFSQQEVHAAVRDAIRLGALSFDAVKHLVLCRLEGRPPRLDLELYPYLPRVRVSTTYAGDYMTLLSGRTA